MRSLPSLGLCRPSSTSCWLWFSYIKPWVAVGSNNSSVQEITMKRSWSFRPGMIFVAVFLCALLPGLAQTRGSAVISRSAEVEGVKLHYLTAGQGPAVGLLHRYTQTSRMWKPIIPLLAEKFTVIAPDLPGIGDSDIPPDG